MRVKCHRLRPAVAGKTHGAPPETRPGPVCRLPTRHCGLQAQSSGCGQATADFRHSLHAADTPLRTSGSVSGSGHATADLKLSLQAADTPLWTSSSVFRLRTGHCGLQAQSSGCGQATADFQPTRSAIIGVADSPHCNGKTAQRPSINYYI